MFSGIIKSMGTIQSIRDTGTTKRITFSSSLSDELNIDQSLSHDGVCLTIVEVQDGTHSVDVVAETLSKTSLQFAKEGHVVNLEKSITATTLLDGHIVQGHVDTILICMDIKDLDGSWNITFNLPADYAGLVIPHGAICLNGVSLTVANLYDDSFEVAIIPYTFENTNFKYLKVGDKVNVEFDVIGKYLLRQSKLSLIS
jgi:riboflavin synthase